LNVLSHPFLYLYAKDGAALFIGFQPGCLILRLFSVLKNMDKIENNKKRDYERLLPIRGNRIFVPARHRG
jgi:hypothetical protein